MDVVGTLLNCLEKVGAFRIYLENIWSM